MEAKEEQREELENKVEESVILSQETNEVLTKAFEKVLLDPSVQNIKAYKDFEKAILAEWAKHLLDNITDDIKIYAKQGRLLAREQLKAKGFNLKTSDKEAIKKSLTTAIDSAKSNIDKIVTGTMLNSRRIISELVEREAILKKKLSRASLDTLKKYGVFYFLDTRGARWDIKRYSEMFCTTTILQEQRRAFFMESIAQGNDLVKIVHLNITPECPLCAPFTGQVLSIGGNSRTYMSVDMARDAGLFHPNCDHISQLELAPDKEEFDNLVALSDQSLRMLQRKGYKLKDIKSKPYYDIR